MAVQCSPLSKAWQMLGALGATLPVSRAWRTGQDLGMLKWGQAWYYKRSLTKPCLCLETPGKQL